MHKYLSFIWNFQKNGVTLKQPLQLLVSDNTKLIMVPARLTFHVTFQAWTTVFSKKPPKLEKKKKNPNKTNEIPNKTKPKRNKQNPPPKKSPHETQQTQRAAFPDVIWLDNDI